MVFQSTLTASVIVLTIWWQTLQCSGAAAYSDKCMAVSSTLSSCFIALQSPDSFMKAESVCCKNMASLERKIDERQFSKYEMCECLKGIAVDDGKQRVLLFNEKLLEVRALCAPNLPYPITSYSDCARMMRGTL